MTKIELAQLSGNPVDDTYAISAGTGVRLNTQSITLSAQSDTLRVTKGITAPTPATINDLWLSTSVADMRVAPGAADRVKILTTTLAWESTSVQEPNLWFDGTNWQMIYTGCGFGPGLQALGWATCSSDPLVATNWTKQANPVLGAGFGGRALQALHAGVYYESGTLYLYYPDVGGTGHIQLQSGSDPLHLGGTTDLGFGGDNFRVFKRGTGDYVAFFTGGVTYADKSSFLFQAFVATASSPAGPWTKLNTGATPSGQILSLNPVPEAGGTDGPVITVEGSTAIGWYHSAMVADNAPCDIWRATIPVANLTTDAWTILDNGYPVLQRAAPWEIDQVADVQVLTDANGFKFLVYDGLDNVQNVSSICATALSPVLKRYNGHSWQPVLAQSKSAYIPGLSRNDFYGMGAGSYVQSDRLSNATPSAGSYNAGFGSRALGSLTTGYQNTAVGASALANMTTPANNTALGYQAGASLLTGPNNTAVGSAALSTATTSQYSVAIGFQALQALTTGNQNVGVGASALFALTTGSNNTVVGYNSGINLTSGASNVAIGVSCMQAQTTPGANVAVGPNALNGNVTGLNQVAVGDHALFTATGGNNTAVGAAAGQGITTGQKVVAIGNGTMSTAGNVTNDSTAVGFQALKVQTGGNNDTAVGSGALVALTTGTSNTAVGQGAMAAMTTASSNTAIGQASLNAATGGSNTAVGVNAGSAILTGTTNTIIGFNAGNTDGTTATNDQSNITLLGERAQATTSDVIVLGKAVNTRPNLIFGGVGATAAFGSGVGVFAIANAITAPTTNPTGGGVLYVSAGALKWRGSAGTVTTIANA